MRPIYENTVIQIDITNACHLACANCTRHVGHHRKPYFMDLDYFVKAIDSVLLSPCRIGVMGGEPTLHPNFRDLLSVLRCKTPIERREFWTAGFKWGLYEQEIKETFLPDRIAYNDHTSYAGMHKPLLVAIEDVVEDPELRAQLIENCPYQSHWSAAITPKGGFFCEIAASLDWLLDGPGGYDISDPHWWNRRPDEFKGQVDEYCGKCGGAIPMESVTDGRGGRDGPTVDVVSAGNLERLRLAGSKKVAAGNVELWTTPVDREFVSKFAALNPRQFRPFVAHDPKDQE